MGEEGSHLDREDEANGEMMMKEEEEEKEEEEDEGHHFICEARAGHVAELPKGVAALSRH